MTIGKASASAGAFAIAAIFLAACGGNAVSDSVGAGGASGGAPGGGGRSTGGETNRDAIITLERQRCFGGCAVYSLKLDADGTVSYEGHAWVGVHGPASRSIGADAVSALADELEAADYFSLSIPDCMLTPDAPTVVTSLFRHGRTRRITHYWGNECAPPILRELEARIDEVAGSADWTRCDGGPCQDM